MGIKGLAKLLSDEAPDCIREVSLSSLHGRKVAVDASMAIYQFLIAVRSGNSNNPAAMLTNAEGETTSHIQGLFNRTIRYMTEGIRPAYVFDGKPPNIKSGELGKRREKREKAQAELERAKEEGNVEEQDKQSKRLVRAGTKENEDCMKLLRLMGVPVVRAPCEAEAQASALARQGVVWAVGTEDMDALTFRTPVLLRKMTFANASKSEIQKMEYQKAIDGLELTHDQFVDLCILLGCDYCDSIRGIGPKTALKLVREHKSIEVILKNIDRNKYGVPDTWVPEEVAEKEKLKKEQEEYNTDDEKEKNNGEGVEEEEEENDTVKVEPIYVQARRLFNNHEVHDSVELKWTECKPDELTKFLVDEMGFNADRVKSSIEKLQKAFKSTSKPQLRMDSFFKPKPGTGATTKKKASEKDIKGKSKKAKTSGGKSFGRRR
mmetsp:Transcript_858/g.1323  ORF Transcript_858/g.1323 Transcript_858/m.1323 type:complete len:434 (+) Transcript_858:60-1361(+)